MAVPQIIRSLVFVGGHDRGKIRQLAESGPDAVCIDLEDSTPLAEKDKARSQFHEVASEIAGIGPLVFVRTNLGGKALEDDLKAVMCPELHCISSPKVESGDSVRQFEKLVLKAEQVSGLAEGGLLIRPVIETAQGVRNAYEIASASARVAYLGGVEGGIFGDLGGSLGYQQTESGLETLYLRSKILIDARAAEVPFPIGGGMTLRQDAQGAREFAKENRILGYNGMHCWGRAEVIAAVNEEFTPLQKEIDEWGAVLPLLEEAERAGLSVAHINDKVYDLIGLVRIREQLTLASRLGIY